MNTKTSHTPTPWIVQESDNPGTGLLIKPVPGQVICEMDGTDAQAQANAAFIVRAVNSHEELLLAAKDAAVMIKNLTMEFNRIGVQTPSLKDTPTFMNLLKAITKAEANQ